jgi:iron complex outermembrane recepter protein
VAGVSGTGQDDGLLTMRGFAAGAMRNGNINTNVGGASSFNSPMITVSRIEVVKGPEAIIAGVSATYGGVVNVITKAPQAAPVRDVEVSLGGRGYYQLGADLGNALSDDKSLLGRLVLSKQGEGQDQAGYDGSNIEYLAPSLSWANRGSGTSVVFSYEHQRSRSKAPLRVFFAPGQPFDPDVKPAFMPPANFGTEDKLSVASLALTQRLGTGWELGLKLSRDHKESAGVSLPNPRAQPRFGFPYPNVIATTFVTDDKLTTRSAKIELKGSFDTGPVEHGLLVAYDDLSSSNESSGRSTAVTALNLSTGQTSDVTPIFGGPFCVPCDFGTTLLKPREKGFLVYDHMVWGQWVALAGWRQMRYEQGDPQVPDQAAFKKGLPSLGVVYRWTPTLSLYGSTSKGFQPNIGLLYADRTPVAPESSTQAELGFKALLADRKLAFTGAVYQIKQRDLAVVDFDNSGPTGLAWLTVPGVTARGAEFEFSGNVTPRLSLRAGYAYLEKKADTPDAQGIVYVRNQASLWAAYRLGDDITSGWWVGAGVQARSGAAGVAGTFGGWIPTPGEARFDLNGGYEAKQWSVVAGVKNLADKRLYTLNSRGDRFGTLVQPREFYATARYSF